MLKKTLFVAAALSAVTMFAPGGASAADIKLTATAIGRPPIFSNTFADVGEALGYWKKVGLDLTFRWFQRGTDTAKAVVTGDAAIGFTATPAAVNLVASGAPVVLVAGMPNLDWLVASNDPKVKTCKDLKGKTVTADGINNARYLYLQALVETCGLKISDMTPIDLANAPLVKASIAGQVHTGVYHVDELAQVEFKTKQKWHLIPAPDSIRKGLHYAAILASKKAIADNKEGIVRFLEGWILTQKIMSSKNPADIDTVAKIAANASKIDVQVAKNAIHTYQSFDFWVNDDGLNEKQMMGQVNLLIKIGSMKADTKPAYAKIVDTSLYAEALKRVKEKGWYK
jgi:ABC-type nitrate/sulfonate/bicarbonate transport system substrate-binding protein